jgi:hypothetical protein
MINFWRREPKIQLSKNEAAALLFHYHKHGIPPVMEASKRLEKRLCDFVGEETNDKYVSPRQELIDKLFPIDGRSHSILIKSVSDDHVRLEDQNTKEIFDLKPQEVLVLVIHIEGIA